MIAAAIIGESFRDPGDHPENQGEKTAAIVTTRPPQPEDAARVAALVHEAGTLEPNSTYAYLLLCTHFQGTCALAESDGEVVGFALAYRLPEAPKILFVWQIGVSPSARRRGVGRRLLDELIRRPSLSDLEFIETTVAPSNAASRSLFERFANAHDVPFRTIGAFESSLFGPASDHEKEEIFRIGPLGKKQ